MPGLNGADRMPPDQRQVPQAQLVPDDPIVVGSPDIPSPMPDFAFSAVSTPVMHVDSLPESDTDNVAETIMMYCIAFFSVMIGVISIEIAASRSIGLPFHVLMWILVVLSIVAFARVILKQYLANAFYAWSSDYDFEFSNIVRKHFNEPRWFKSHRSTSGRSHMPSFTSPFLTVDHNGRYVLFVNKLESLRNAKDIIDATAFIDSEPALNSFLWSRVLRFVDRWKAGYFILGKLDWRVNRRVPIARILYLLRNETNIEVAIWEAGKFETVEFRPYSAELFESILSHGKKGFVQIEKEIKDTYFQLYFGLLQHWRHQNPYTVCGVLIDALLRHEKPRIANLEEYENKFNLVFQLQRDLVRFPRHYNESTLLILETHMYEANPKKFGFFKCFLPESADRYQTLNRLLEIAMCALDKERFCVMLANGEMRSVDFQKFCVNYCAYANLRASLFRKTDAGQTLIFQTEGRPRSKDVCLLLTLSDRQGMWLSEDALSARAVYSLSKSDSNLENVELIRTENDYSSYVV